MKEEEMNVQDVSCECECNATESLRATLEEVTLAVEHLADVIGRFDGNAAVCTLVDEGDGIRQMFRVTGEAMTHDNTSKLFKWAGACGFLMKSKDCVVNAKHKAVSEGISLFLEKQMESSMPNKGKVIAAMLGLGGSNDDED